jgi:hypothetical protein
MLTRQDTFTFIASVEMVKEDKTKFILAAQSAKQPIWLRRSIILNNGERKEMTFRSLSFCKWKVGRPK